MSPSLNPNRYPDARRPAPRRRRRAGFTLAEAMLACLLLVFGFLPILTVLAMSQRLERQAQVRSVAYNAARAQLEALQARSWSTLQPVGDTAFAVPEDIQRQLPYSGGAVNTADRSLRLVGTYNVTEPIAGNNRMRQITVMVRWRNAVNNRNSNGPASSVWMSAMVSQQPN